MNCNREGVRNFDLGWRIVVKILKMRNYKILPFVRQNFGMAAATPLTTSLDRPNMHFNLCNENLSKKKPGVYNNNFRL